MTLRIDSGIDQDGAARTALSARAGCYGSLEIVIGDNDMMKTRDMILSATVAAVLLLAAACTATPTGDESLVMETFERNSDGYADITAEQLAELLEETEAPLINVHVPLEGEIPGTDLHIAYDEIADHLDQLPGKDDPVILYCRSGSMSTAAAEVLASLGYTEVVEVDGGMRAWAEAGYDLTGRQGW